MSYQGDYFEDDTVLVSFTTNDSAGGVVAPSSAFEAADVKVYKDGVAFAPSGVTMTSPFDGITGLHKISIDTSDDAGDDWVAGADYTVVLEPDETVDGQTVVAVLATFSIENRNQRGTDSAATATQVSNLNNFDPATDEVDIGKVKGVGVTNVDDFKANVSALALEATSQDILAQVTGTGNRVITINVKDDSANNLQDVLVRIDTSSTYTDVSGNAVFALDDGDYDVILRKAYVDFTVPEPLTVVGDGTHPYVGALIVPSLPTQPDTCMVYGVVIDNGGFVVPGASIFINETDNDTFANTQKIVKNRQTTSDDNGFWELEIVRSSQLDPADSPYDVIITYPNGFKYETTITVPDQSSVEFSTIAGT